MGSITAETVLELSPKVKALLEQEHEYTAGAFNPMPSVFERAEGCKLWVSHSRANIHVADEPC